MNTVILFLSIVAGATAVSIPIGVPGTDCATTLCLLPECSADQILVTPSGKCCPECICSPETNCIAISECPPGQRLEVPKGQCCATCVLEVDCSAVLCLRPECEEDEMLVTPVGQCCPRCERNCSAVPCPNVQCFTGFEPQVPKGQCCPVCVPTDPVCTVKGQTVIDCARVCPHPTCDGPDIFCITVCNPGRRCQCPDGQVIDTVNNVCVPRDECPTEDPCDSCEEDEICRPEVAPCLVPPCPVIARCLNRTEVCSLPSETGPCRASIRRYFHNPTSGRCEVFTYGGCQGNDNNYESLEECENECGANPDLCEDFSCPKGHRCSTFEGEAFCSPDCGLNNGGCAKDEICQLEEVLCVRAPCPPARVCLDPCATVRCANGYRCKVFEGRPFCDPDCSLNNGGCADSEVCRLQDVLCKKAPCPPTIVCDSIQPACPPTCSKDFCAYNPRAACTRPGPREIPGCTGSCSLSNCLACVFNEEPLDPSISDSCTSRACSSVSGYTANRRCFRRWARCTRRQHKRAPGFEEASATDDNFKCYSPPCSLRG